MIAAGSLFTSCVTNTEPQGVKDLREAKADYLESLARLRDADAALVKAEAAFQDAKTALKNAEVREKELANALQEAKNDRAIAMEKALAEQEAVKAKEALAKAEAALQETLRDLAVKSKGLTETEKNAITDYTTKYDEYIKELAKVRKAEEAVYDTTLSFEEYLLKQQKDSAEALATIEYYTEEINNLPDSGNSHADSVKFADKQQKEKLAVEFAKANLEKEWNLYQSTNVNDAIKGFASGLVDWIAQNVALPAPFVMNYKAQLPDNEQVCQLLAKYLKYPKLYADGISSFIPGFDGLNVTQDIDGKWWLTANFVSAPEARAEIYGDGQSAIYGDLASVVEALNREFVVDSTRFGMDTTGMAAAVAAAVKDYKAVQDTLEHKVDAYPGVIAAKAAFETAFGEYEEADEAYEESAAAFEADKAALIASVKTFRSTWDSVANNTGKLSTKDSVVIFNALKAVMAARKVVFPEEKQYYYYWKTGDKGQAVRDSVEFSEMEFKGLQRNRRGQSTYGGHSDGHGGVTWGNNAYELTWIFEEAFEGLTGQGDHDSFFNDKINQGNQSIEEIGSDEALINAISMRDNLYRKLLFGKYFYGQNDDEGKILKYGYFQSEGNEVAEISRIEEAEKHEANKKKEEGRKYEPAAYIFPYVDTDHEYFRKSVLDAMDVADEAAYEANEAWRGIYDARDYFYKNFYCKFWGIRYSELCESKKFSETHARFNDDSDSLRIEFSLETFTEPTPIVSFKFDGTTTYKDGKFIYDGRNVDHKWNAIDEEDVIPNIQFFIVDKEVFSRFEDVYSRHHDIGFEFGKTLLAKVLYKQAVLASVHTDGQGTKESLAALKDICVDVVNAYEAALKKQSADSEPFYKFIEGLVGKETLAYIFDGLDKALAKAVEYIPATVQTENNIAWAMYYDVINKIANKELTSKEALIAIFEDFMCGETTLPGSKWIWVPSHFAKWFNRYPSVNELNKMTSTLTQEGPRYQNAQYFKAYVALQLSDAFSGDQFRTILADVVKYYLNAIDVDLAGIDNTLENIIEKVLFGTVRSLNGDFNNIDNVVDVLFALFSDDSDDSDKKDQGEEQPTEQQMKEKATYDVVNSVAEVRTSGSDSQGDEKVAESLKLALKAIFVATPTILNHIIADCDGIICQLDKKYFTEWRTKWAEYDVAMAKYEAQLTAIDNADKAYKDYAEGIKDLYAVRNLFQKEIDAATEAYDNACANLEKLYAGVDWKTQAYKSSQDALEAAKLALKAAEYRLAQAKKAYDQVLANHKND